MGDLGVERRKTKWRRLSFERRLAFFVFALSAILNYGRGDAGRNASKVRTSQDAMEINLVDGTDAAASGHSVIRLLHVHANLLDKSTDLDFAGFAAATASVGCSMMNPVFGYWNQRTMSVLTPLIVGNTLMAAGQLLYGLLPLFHAHIKWIMLAARFVTGAGAGSMSVARAYVAMTSAPADRTRAVCICTAGYTLVSAEGFRIGPVVVNMYTLPAFSMSALAILCSALLKTFFVADYAGLITKTEREVNKEIVVPKFDMWAALICIYLHMITRTASTTAEVIATPVTMVFYDWNDAKAIFINGILLAICCVICVVVYWAMAYTRIGKIDIRKQAICGIACFVIYYGSHFGWPFYEGPLNFVPKDANGTEDSSIAGGCFERYAWCKSAVRVPLPIYMTGVLVLFSLAFCFLDSPSHTLFSLVLGPREQGTMQGVMAFGGSLAQFVMPLIATLLFEHFGYQPVVLIMLGQLFIGLVLTLVFYARLVPLKVRLRE